MTTMTRENRLVLGTMRHVLIPGDQLISVMRSRMLSPATFMILHVDVRDDRGSIQLDGPKRCLTVLVACAPRETCLKRYTYEFFELYIMNYWVNEPESRVMLVRDAEVVFDSDECRESAAQ